jgi:hypothetical protein
VKIDLAAILNEYTISTMLDFSQIQQVALNSNLKPAETSDSSAICNISAILYFIPLLNVEKQNFSNRLSYPKISAVFVVFIEKRLRS